MNACFCSEKKQNYIYFAVLFCFVILFHFVEWREFECDCQCEFDVIIYLTLLENAVCMRLFCKRNDWIEFCYALYGAISHCKMLLSLQRFFSHGNVIETFFFILSKIESSSEIFSIDIAAGPRNEHCFDLNIDFYQNDVVEPRPTVSMR